MAPSFENTLAPLPSLNCKADDSEQTPKARSSPLPHVCLDYIKGQCVGKRTQCRFVHPDLTEFHRLCASMPPGCTVCEVFVMTGQCKFGPKCSKIHPIFVKVDTTPPATPQRPPTSPMRSPASPTHSPASPKRSPAFSMRSPASSMRSPASSMRSPASPMRSPASFMHLPTTQSAPVSPQHPLISFPHPVFSLQLSASSPSLLSNTPGPRTHKPLRPVPPHVAKPVDATQEKDMLNVCVPQENFVNSMKSSSGLLKGISFEQLLKDLY